MAPKPDPKKKGKKGKKKEKPTGPTVKELQAQIVILEAEKLKEQSERNVMQLERVRAFPTCPAYFLLKWSKWPCTLAMAVSTSCQHFCQPEETISNCFNSTTIHIKPFMDQNVAGQDTCLLGHQEGGVRETPGTVEDKRSLCGGARGEAPRRNQGTSKPLLCPVLHSRAQK